MIPRNAMQATYFHTIEFVIVKGNVARSKDGFNKIRIAQEKEEMMRDWRKIVSDYNRGEVK